MSCILGHLLSGELPYNVSFVHIWTISQLGPMAEYHKNYEGLNYPVFSIGISEDMFALHRFFLKMVLKKLEFCFYSITLHKVRLVGKCYKPVSFLSLSPLQWHWLGAWCLIALHLCQLWHGQKERARAGENLPVLLFSSARLPSGDPSRSFCSLLLALYIINLGWVTAFKLSFVVAAGSESRSELSASELFTAHRCLLNWW